MSINIQHQLLQRPDQDFLTAIIEGQPYLTSSGHPNFKEIVAICAEAYLNDGEYTGDKSLEQIVGLFDLVEAVKAKFERLSDRIAVKNGNVYLDGDPVDSSLAEQIASFLDQGVDDWQPLVRFYEKLLTNPLGNVQQGVYDWIKGRAGDDHAGKVTIAPDGDLIGYKSVAPATPEWRTDEETVYVPSRRGEGVVNGVDVAHDQFIEQVPGDTVEMPRSRVLNAPSQACGDGLHIGTWGYASTFYGGSTVMLVKFNPRDIVSLPDSNATWKLRVCRYQVLDIVTEPLDTPLYLTADAVEEASDGETVELGDGEYSITIDLAFFDSLDD